MGVRAVYPQKRLGACLFGGLLLAMVLLTHRFWPPSSPIARYDALFLMALLLQFTLLAFRLETLREAKFILLFHVVGTGMELFKTHVGSWQYPEHNLLRIGGVPMFSGFMYAAVGSYLARATRIFDLRYTRFPRRRWTVPLILLIFLNFFTHHFMRDLRLLLFVAVAVIFGRTWVYFRPFRAYRRMPLVASFALIALFLWIAEDVATYAHIWIYPHQHGAWHAVRPEKFGSWFLLMIVSYVLIVLVHTPQHPPDDATASCLDPAGLAIEPAASSWLFSHTMQRNIVRLYSEQLCEKHNRWLKNGST